jgi:hypothetical protein
LLERALRRLRLGLRLRRGAVLERALRSLRVGLRLSRQRAVLERALRRVRLGLGLPRRAVLERALRRVRLGLGLPRRAVLGRPLLERHLTRDPRNPASLAQRGGRPAGTSANLASRFERVLIHAAPAVVSHDPAVEHRLSEARR